MKATRKKAISYIVSSILTLGILTGGYFTYKFVNTNKEHDKATDSLFYSGCNTLCDSINRIYDAGGSKYVHIDSKDIPVNMKKDYIKQNKLEGKLK